MEASSIESDGEWVRQRSFERRECIHCGRRQERSDDEEWQGYHISAAQEPKQQASNSDEETPPISELRRAAARHRER